MVDYIFLSREVPLSLSILKFIKESEYSFSEITQFSEHQFKSFLNNIKRNYKINLRNIDVKVSSFIFKKKESTFLKIEEELKICERNQIKCLSHFDEEFPNLLRRIKPPPKLIFMKGTIRDEDEKAIAIIGSRNPTSYGKEMAEKIAKKFVELGFTVISGFARGIDTIAIKSALDNGGRAIGVIASGILNLYPPENTYLVEKLINNGALISERFPLKSVNKRALQIRNRITSGLALGNIFVEGNKFSGSKWQLKFGKQQGKIPIAVKPIGDYEQSYVPNLVINQGYGEIISDIEDIDYVAEVLMNELKERKNSKSKTGGSKIKQINLLKFKY